VAKGTRIDGILEMEKKLDLSHAFKIKGSRATLEFKFSPEALKLMESPPPPATPATPPK
jgi:hypothetical protein